MNKYIPLTKNIGIEIDLCWHNRDRISIFVLDWNVNPYGTDHAGMYFLFSVWRLQFEFNVASRLHASYDDEDEPTRG